MAQIRVAAATVWSAILILSACRSLPKQETPALRFPDKQDLSSYNELRSASRGTSYLLARQIGAAHKSTVVHIGPIVSVDSGEIVRSGQDLQTLMLLDLQQLLPGHSVRRLTSGATDNSWFVTGTFRYEKAAKDSSEPWFRLDVNASAPTGQVMPVLSMRVNVRQFDPTPSRFFQDAPMYLLDAHARQRTALSLTIGGQVSPEIRRRVLMIESPGNIARHF